MTRFLSTLLATALLVAGCGIGDRDNSRTDPQSRQRPASPAPTFRTLEPADVAEQVQSGEMLLVDVREDHEWDAGHAPRAIHVPLSEVEERIGEIERAAADRPVAFICRTGSRSAEAAAIAVAEGVGDVHHVAGGMAAWVEDGLPLEPADGRIA